MLDGPEPITIKNAGELVFADIDYPTPVKVLMMVMAAWIFFGPILIFLGIRRGHAIRSTCIYAAGALLSTAVLTAIEWAEPISDDFAHRFGVLWRYFGSQLLLTSLGLSLLAALLGYVMRRRSGPRPR
jgi:hypothetical protein